MLEGKVHPEANETAYLMPAQSEDPKATSRPKRQPLPFREAAIWLRYVAQTQQVTLGFATAVITVVIIAWLTLTPQGTTLPDHFDVCVPCGRFGTADFTLNVMVFMPLGFGLRLAGMRRRWAWLIAAALTVTIETLRVLRCTRPRLGPG